MTEKLDFTKQLLTLSFSTKPTDSPVIEPFQQNHQVLKISTKGSVMGDIVGEMSQSITEVHAVPPPNHQGIAISFMLKTELGVIEGYYSGSIHDIEGENMWVINGYGLILSVTSAYADLFLAEVFVKSDVPREDGNAQGENGQMTISPR